MNFTLLILGLLALVLLVSRQNRKSEEHPSPFGYRHGFIAHRKDGKAIERCDLGEPYDDCRYDAKEAIADWLAEGRYSRIEYIDPTGKQTVFTEEDF